MTYSILIIESDENVVEIISLLLEEWNYSVIHFTDPWKVNLTHIKVDLAIVEDWVLSAIEKTEEFLKTFNDHGIPLIVTSTEPDMQSVLLKYKVQHGITKPFNINEFKALIDGLLR